MRPNLQAEMLFTCDFICIRKSIPHSLLTAMIHLDKQVFSYRNMCHVEPDPLQAVAVKLFPSPMKKGCGRNDCIPFLI